MRGAVSEFVGSDVSKDTLDVALRPSRNRLSFSNDEAGIIALIGELKDVAPALVVLEATGSYKTASVAALSLATTPVARRLAAWWDERLCAAEIGMRQLLRCRTRCCLWTAPFGDGHKYSGISAPRFVTNVRSFSQGARELLMCPIQHAD